MNAIFKKTLLVSLLGHITFFSIFSFSSGNRIPKADYSKVAFWGAILHTSDLISHGALTQDIKRAFIREPDTAALDRMNKQPPLEFNYYLKPAVNLTLIQDKISFTQKFGSPAFISRPREPVIMFHPHLPQNFLIYFQDRQAVHIELMFNIISGSKTNSINIKRKISSGNLEADLLAMRYIGHYLFIQQPGFPRNNWQTVKIDLSAKND